jgi:hypothetical protein
MDFLAFPAKYACFSPWPVGCLPVPFFNSPAATRPKGTFNMRSAVKEPKPQGLSRRDKVCKMMNLRGISDWFECKLEIFYKPVASVPNAPNFIELMDLDVNKQELVELLTNLCANHWDNESELDEALAFLETEAGKKLIDRGGALAQKLNAVFDHYIKTRLDAKFQAFKHSTLQ